ncbi:MAG: GNAT family N-acetyltransferase [Thermoleophilia bacterium]|nr:GNAT family N-acetyltransferase [Thermoleophilia bacterium]
MARSDPPYRVRTERLLIRCWEPRDAPLLKEAVDSSLDHLRDWMPWAQAEPQPLEEKVALLRRFRARFDLGEDFVYGILAPDESEVVGGTGLHTRVGDDAFEIGYWIRASRAGSGLATEATAALTRVAFAVCGADRVEIRVDPPNAPSAAIPRKLGFTEEATLRRRLPGGAAGSGPRDVVVFSLFSEEFAASAAAGATVEAFDAAGARVL